MSKWAPNQLPALGKKTGMDEMQVIWEAIKFETSNTRIYRGTGTAKQAAVKQPGI